MNREMLPSEARTPSAPNRASTRFTAACTMRWSVVSNSSRRRRRGPRRAVPACGHGSRRPRPGAAALRRSSSSSRRPDEQIRERRTRLGIRVSRHRLSPATRCRAPSCRAQQRPRTGLSAVTPCGATRHCDSYDHRPSRSRFELRRGGGPLGYRRPGPVAAQLPALAILGPPAGDRAVGRSGTPPACRRPDRTRAARGVWRRAVQPAPGAARARRPTTRHLARRRGPPRSSGVRPLRRTPAADARVAAAARCGAAPAHQPAAVRGRAGHRR